MATAVGTYATLTLAKQRLGWGTATTTDDALLQTICDQVNGWVESSTGRIIAPYAGTYTFDGYDAYETSSALVRLGWVSTLPVRRGLVSLASLELAAQTGYPFVTVPTTDYFLEPSQPEPGWPYFRVVLTDIPTSGNQFAYFPPGFQNVRLAGTFGWPAIPDELTDVALTTVVRAWNARQAGQADIVGTDEYGKPLVSRYVSGRDRETISRFKFKSGI